MYLIEIVRAVQLLGNDYQAGDVLAAARVETAAMLVRNGLALPHDAATAAAVREFDAVLEQRRTAVLH
jgi:hypothetical protein